MSKIDIFIPYWGDPKLMQQAVESVLNQSSDKWNLIILDDHYDSIEAKKYFDNIIKHPKVTYIRHRQNLGITRNFNYAINYAKSPLTVIMGCDDIMLPNYVESAINHIGEADIYQPGVEVINERGEKYLPLTDIIKKLLTPKRGEIYSGQKLAASLCIGHWLYFPSICWKTDMLKQYPFNEKYKIVEDVDSQLSMIMNGAKLKIGSNITFQYRRFSESLSSLEKSKEGVRFKEEAEVYETFSQRFQDKSWPLAAFSAKIRVTSRINKLLSALTAR